MNTIEIMSNLIVSKIYRSTIICFYFCSAAITSKCNLVEITLRVVAMFTNDNTIEVSCVKFLAIFERDTFTILASNDIFEVVSIVTKPDEKTLELLARYGADYRIMS